MSDLSPLDKAEAAVAQAESNTGVVQVAMAALELAKAAQQQPQHHCQHDHQTQPPFDAKKWWTIGGLAIVGAGAASVLAVAFALASIAVAIGASCATCCLLVLRSMWRDMQRGR